MRASGCSLARALASHPDRVLVRPFSMVGQRTVAFGNRLASTGPVHIFGGSRGLSPGRRSGSGDNPSVFSYPHHCIVFYPCLPGPTRVIDPLTEGLGFFPNAPSAPHRSYPFNFNACRPPAAVFPSPFRSNRKTFSSPLRSFPSKSALIAFHGGRPDVGFRQRRRTSLLSCRYSAHPSPRIQPRIGGRCTRCTVM
jgi:hypothetical protein